jgi:hypothetical protein
MPKEEQAPIAPEETPEAIIGAGEASEAGAKPESEESWLIPGKFRTQEDALKSYDELERNYGRQTTELGRLRAENEQMVAAWDAMQRQPAAQQPSQELQIPEDEYLTGRQAAQLIEQALEKGFSKHLGPFQQRLAETTVLAARQQVERDPDYELIKTDFEQRLSLIRDPAALGNPEAIRALYQLVKGENVDKVVEGRARKATAGQTAAKATLGRISGATPSQGDLGKAVALTDEQRRASAALGITSDEELSQWAKPDYRGPLPKAAEPEKPQVGT